MGFQNPPVFGGLLPPPVLPLTNNGVLWNNAGVLAAGPLLTDDIGNVQIQGNLKGRNSQSNLFMDQGTGLAIWTTIGGVAGAGVTFDYATDGVLKLRNRLNNADGTFNAGTLILSGRSKISSPTDGNLLLQNNAGTGFSLLQLGGITSASPALRVTGAVIGFRLGDNSGDAHMTAAAGTFSGDLQIGNKLVGASASVITLGVDGILKFSNNAVSAGISLDVSSDGIAKFRNRANSADAALTASSGTFSTTLATAAPAGSSAGLWKLGALQAGAVVLDTTRSIFVDIGGTVYKLMVAQ